LVCKISTGAPGTLFAPVFYPVISGGGRKSEDQDFLARAQWLKGRQGERKNKACFLKYELVIFEYRNWRDDGATLVFGPRESKPATNRMIPSSSTEVRNG
jgi:hypothetical protein